jgi:acyl-CoA reductase-like NAD-dependent aldehyde dehydrogenase
VREALDQGAVNVTSSKLATNGTDKRVATEVFKHPAQLHPTVLTGVTPSMRLYSEESFGPTVSVHTFQTEEEAIKLANESEYGLSAAIFTKDIARAIWMARKITSGAVHINGNTIHDEPQLPHGGMKSSGWGRFGVPWGKSRTCQVPLQKASDINLIVNIINFCAYSL